ncbi:MAG: methyltransferase domain-containing protein [Dehalococcoidia bacterium]|nr:methyltransferase domain-containing protein [Dehalococcoidia bacterium]
MPEDLYAPVAGLYDLSYGDYTEDIDFYESLAQAVDSPLLELGVGTGRVALPLAQAGHAVVGLDASASMLAIARENLSATKLRKGSLDLVAGNMTNFDLGRRFGMVFVAADTFQHLLTTHAQLACIECVARHLEPNGIFALSIRSPASVAWDDAGLPSPLLLDWTRTDANGDLVMKFVAGEADPARMVRKQTYIYDRVHDGVLQRNVFIAELRYSTQAEIELLLQQAGLHVTHVYGDYDLTPVGLGDNLIFVARAEESR